MKIIVTQQDMQIALGAYLTQTLGIRSLDGHQVIIEGSNGIGGMAIDFGNNVTTAVQTGATQSETSPAEATGFSSITDTGPIEIPESAKSSAPGGEVTVGDNNGDADAGQAAQVSETDVVFATGESQGSETKPEAQEVASDDTDLFSRKAAPQETVEDTSSADTSDAGLFGGAGAVEDNAADAQTVGEVLQESADGPIKEQKQEDVKLFG